MPEEKTEVLSNIFSVSERPEDKNFVVYTEHLRKVYEGKTVALKNLTLGIEYGDIFGLIGPNGAGKTTLLTILATQQEPTYGKAWIAGWEVVEERDQVHRVMGYMSDTFAVYDDLKVWEYLDFFAHAYELNKSERNKRVSTLLEILNLGVKRNDFCKGLSRGMKQRLCLGRAIIHDPQILILDEPASGLDPIARIEFRKLLLSLQELGKTVIISSHILTEMSEFCNSVGIIEKGEMIEAGKVQDILDRINQHTRVEIEFIGASEVIDGILKNAPHIHGYEIKGQFANLRFTGSLQNLAELQKELVLAGVFITSFKRIEDNLEDIFLKLSNGNVS